MAFAMIMMLVAALFISGTASLMTNRAHQSGYMDLIMKRRIALENSKYFNQQMMLEKTFVTSSSMTGNQPGEFADGWGGLNTADGWANMRIYESWLLPDALTTVYPYNYTGLRPWGTYLNVERTVRPLSLDGYVDEFSAYSFLKTFAPSVAGDSLVVYRKPTSANGQIEIGDTPNGPLRILVDGRMVVRDSDSLFAPSTPSPLELRVYAKDLYIQQHNGRRVYCRDDQAKKISPSNLPAMRSTVGPNVETITPTDLFNASLNVVNNPSNPDNSIWHMMDREKGAGRGDIVTISSGAATGVNTDPWYIEEQTNPTYPPPGWPSGYPPVWKVLFIDLAHADLKHIRINGVVNSVVFKGQANSTDFTAARLLPPIMITSNADGVSGFTSNVTDLRFVNENNRRVVFGLNDPNGEELGIYWEGSSRAPNLIEWRMLLVNEYRTISAFLPASITKRVVINGGLMTNWTFKRFGNGAASRLTLRPDTDPNPVGSLGPTFTSLLPREAWLENYFILTPP